MSRLVLLAWLRFLVVALSLHVGGLALASVVVEDPCVDESGCCSDCPIEGSGQECPPGCPNCHCHHPGGAVAIPELKGDKVSLPAPEQGNEQGRPREATAPREPPLPSLFRPPRAPSLLT
jgi:hypothetical protein